MKRWQDAGADGLKWPNTFEHGAFGAGGGGEGVGGGGDGDGGGGDGEGGGDGDGGGGDGGGGDGDGGGGDGGGGSVAWMQSAAWRADPLLVFIASMPTCHLQF